MAGWKWRGDPGEYIPGLPAADIAEEQVDALAEARGVDSKTIREWLDRSAKYERMVSIKPPKPVVTDGPMPGPDAPVTMSDIDPDLPKAPSNK